MKPLKKFATIVLAAHIANFSVLSIGQAAMVSTDEVARTVAEQTQSSQAKLSSYLTREEVQVELARMGVNVDDARARVAALTDEEATQMTQQIEQAPAGGIIGAIVFVFLVLLITDILGLTKVFPFTRPVR